MCSACRMYLSANGHDRPADPEIRREIEIVRKSISRKKFVDARGFVSCRNCKENRAVSNGLCKACDTYKRRNNGKTRPRHLIYQRCNNCECPIGSSSRTGLCRRCYWYNKAFNKPRPEHAWKIVDPWLGWCECSTRTEPVPATHTITIAIGTPNHSDSNRREQIHVCQSCHDIHQVVERGPRSNHRRDSHATT